MRSMRRMLLAAAVIGVGEVVIVILTYGSGLMVPPPEQAAPGAADGLWRQHLDIVEKELERGRVDVAVRVWHDAHGAALASRTWESMIAVGDAFMAIGRASGSARGARSNAREAYTTALIRARRAGSVDGALRCAEAFRQLDERLIAEQSLRIAEQMADGSAPARERVREVRQGWAVRDTATEF